MSWSIAPHPFLGSDLPSAPSRMNSESSQGSLCQCSYCCSFQLWMPFPLQAQPHNPHLNFCLIFRLFFGTEYRQSPWWHQKNKAGFQRVHFHVKFLVWRWPETLQWDGCSRWTFPLFWGQSLLTAAVTKISWEGSALDSWNWIVRDWQQGFLSSDLPLDGLPGLKPGCLQDVVAKRVI